MKNLFTLFITIFLYIFSTTSFSQEKVNVLLVFGMKNKFVLTSNSLIEGIRVAKKKFDKQNKVNLITISTTQNIKDVFHDTSKAIKKYKPDLIVGAITSNVALVISKLAEKEKIPFITPFATNPEVTKGKKYTYRMCFDDNYQSKILAKFVIKSQKAKRGIIFYNEKSSYAIGIQEIFNKYFKLYGGENLDIFPYSKVSDINQAMILKALKSKPDFFFIPSYQIEAGAIINKVAKHTKKKTLFLGPDSWAGGNLFFKNFMNNKKNIKGFYVKHWYKEIKNNQNKSFNEALKGHQFSKIFKNKTLLMKTPAAVGYDTGKFFFSAFDKVTTPKNINKMLKTVNIDGVTGNLKMDKNNTPNKGLFIFSISKNGEKFFKKFK